MRLGWLVLPAAMLVLAAPAWAAEDDYASTVQGLRAVQHLARAKAEDELVAGGPAAVPALIAGLGDASPRVREGAARVLRRIGDVSARPALVAALAREVGANGEPPADAGTAYEICCALVVIDPVGAAYVSRVADGAEPALASLDAIARRARAHALLAHVRAELAAASGGGTYRGRFIGLRRYGRAGVSALGALVRRGLNGESPEQALAPLALQALGDGGDPEVRDELHGLADLIRDGKSKLDAMDREKLLQETGRALSWQGDHALMDEMVAAKRRELDMAGRVGRGIGGGGRADVKLQLAHLLLYRGLFKDAANEFREAGATEGGRHWVDGYYNAACAASLDGDTVQALKDLRAAVLGTDGAPGYAEVRWLSEDGDLANVRKTPEFPYLRAAVIARTQVGGFRGPQANAEALGRMLDDLREALARGHRVRRGDQLEGYFQGVRGHAGYEALARELRSPPPPRAPATPPTTADGGGR